MWKSGVLRETNWTKIVWKNMEGVLRKKVQISTWIRGFLRFNRGIYLWKMPSLRKQVWEFDGIWLRHTEVTHINGDFATGIPIKRNQWLVIGYCTTYVCGCRLRSTYSPVSSNMAIGPLEFPGIFPIYGAIFVVQSSLLMVNAYIWLRYSDLTTDSPESWWTQSCLSSCQGMAEAPQEKWCGLIISELWECTQIYYRIL